MSGKNRGSLKNPLPKVRSLNASIFSAPQRDDSYLQYASVATQQRYIVADYRVKSIILDKVTKKYKPVVDALDVEGGIFDLIDQLQDCNMYEMDTEGGNRKKMRGGDLAAVKAALKKLWVEIVSATFTPDNVLKAFPVAVIGIANPTLAGSLFTAAKTAVGAVAGVCLTNAGITAISVGALMYLYDVNLDINKLNLNAADIATLTALRDDLKKNLKPGGKFGSVAQPTQALLDKVEKIRNQQAAAAKAADDKAKADAIAAELEKTSKEAAVIVETAAPPSTPTASSGGRKTKKRSMKKFKKTRRGIRKPLFKY
jgi:hypothetical protein